MIQQTDFDAASGLPRWGCMWLAVVVAAWQAAENREPTKDEVTRVYNDCRANLAWNGRPVLEMVNNETREIVLNDPTKALTTALSYTNNGWRGRQYPDLDTKVPGAYPRDYRLTYTLLNFKRTGVDGHWVLGDRSGMNVLYNPDESLTIDWWNRGPRWRGLQIWRV